MLPGGFEWREVSGVILQASALFTTGGAAKELNAGPRRWLAGSAPSAMSSEASRHQRLVRWDVRTFRRAHLQLRNRTLK